MPGRTVEEQAAAFLAKNDIQFYREAIISFITDYKQKVLNKEITAGTLNMYYHTIKLFYDMSDITEQGINWNKISRGLPKGRTVANDRAISLEEIRKLLEYADRRMKVLITVMFSSGIRVGAWEYLQLKHVIPVHDSGVAKLIVYDDENEQYYSFISPEAHAAIKEWIAYRQSYDEKITPESYIMRDLWQTTDTPTMYGNGAATGLATHPKKITTNTIQKMLSRALKKQGIRQPLKKGIRRHPFKLAHGLRKAFRSKAGQVMHHMNVELIMGHKTTGTTETYWRPSEQEVLEDYLQAVPLLSVNSSGSVGGGEDKTAEHLTQRIKEIETKLSGFQSLLERLNQGKKQIEDNFQRKVEREEEG